MRSGRFIGVICLVLALVLIAGTTTARADFFYRTKSSTSSYVMMGDTIPASEMEVVGWIGEKMTRMDMDTASVVVDLEKGIMYMIDHQKKTYGVLNLEELGDMMAGMGAEGEEAEAMKQMMQAMMGQMKYEVTPTEETKKIGDYNCKKYDATMSMMMVSMDQEIWATEEIDIDMTKYYQMAYAAMWSMPLFSKIVEESKKIKGFPVHTVMTADMMGSPMTTTSDLIEVGEQDAPEGTYALPEGYKEEKLQK